MNKLKFLIAILIFIGSSIMVIGGFGFEGHGLKFLDSGSLGATEYSGVRIQALQNISIYRVDLASGVTGTRLTIFNESVTETPDARLNQSVISGTTTYINATLTAGQYYFLVVNTTSGSNWVHNCSGGTVPSSQPPIRGVSVSWVNGSVTSGGNIVTASLGNVCNIKEIYYQDSKLGINSSTYNNTVIESSLQSFSSNFTSSVEIVSGSLIYNNTAYSSTVSNPSTNVYTLHRSIDIPLGKKPILANQFYWNLTYSNGTTVSSSPQTQYFNVMNLSICGSAPQDVIYYNITFKNETAAEERVNASIPSSTWTYWLGSGSVNRSLSYSSLSENDEYDFCFSPSSSPVNSNIDLFYTNGESQQREFTSNEAVLSSVTTLKTLYLLPTSSGIFSPFQTVNAAGSPIGGVTATISRSLGGSSVVVATATTDSSGFSTFFLNPDVTYSAVFSKEGFADVTFSFVPTNDLRTVTIGTGGQGITNGTTITINTTYVAFPLDLSLQNNTSYSFGLQVNSTQNINYISLNITNRSGYQFAFVSSNSAGTISTSLNTGNNQTFIGRYTIQTSTESFTVTKIFIIGDTYVGDYSFYRQFTTFLQYEFSDFFRIVLILIVLIVCIVYMSNNEIVDTSENKVLAIALIVWIFSYLGWLSTGIIINSTNGPVSSLAAYSDKYGIAMLVTVAAIYSVMRRNG